MTLSATEISTLVQLAQHAADAILDVYAKESFETETKSDESPVTEADLAANAVIVAGLERHFADVFVVSEEVALPSDTVLPNRFFLVDPLDGTKSFIERTGEFTVNIGLIENGAPVWGVVVVPVTRTCYFVGADGAAYRQVGDAAAQKIHVRTPPPEGLTVVASQSHCCDDTKAYIDALPNVAAWKSVGSSLKFCAIAAGEADVYPRCGPTMEWDTAAAHAVVNAAGGSVTAMDGTPFTYGHMAQDRPLLNGAFVAQGKK